MKQLGFLLIIAVFIFSVFDTNGQCFQLGGKELVKAGTGNRTKGILGTLYFATLYVPQELKGKPAKEVIEADRPMSVMMHIYSRLLTRERFTDAVNEGFVKASTTGYPTEKKDAFLKLFDSIEINKGDVIYLNYVPGEGLSPSYIPQGKGDAKLLGTIAGLEFKKALFAIWLGPNPVQESLKKALLGN